MLGAAPFAAAKSHLSLIAGWDQGTISLPCASAGKNHPPCGDGRSPLAQRKRLDLRSHQDVSLRFESMRLGAGAFRPHTPETWERLKAAFVPGRPGQKVPWGFHNNY